MTPHLLVTVVSMLLVTSLTAAPPASDYFPDLRAACQKIAHMKIGPSGVTQAQADLLADTYFQIYLGQCGGADPVQPKRDYWSAAVIVGYAGVHDGALRIDRVTGAVTYHSHPRLYPKDFPGAFSREYSR